MPWTFLLKARYLISKYYKIVIYHFSSIWYEIKDLYDVVLEHTYWTIDSSIDINFLNDLWCFLGVSLLLQVFLIFIDSNFILKFLRLRTIPLTFCFILSA